MVDQTAMGHTIVLLWTVVRRIPGLWLIPVDIIPQEDCHPCLIYDYTWIGLNATVLRKDPPMAMQFRWALMRLLCHILHLDPALRPVFLSKVDLSDMYMRVWVCLEYIPHLLFDAPPHPSITQTLIVFHLSLSMVCADSAPYLCCTSNTLANIVNARWGGCPTSSPHHLYTVATSSLYIANNIDAGFPSEDLGASLADHCAGLFPDSHACLLRYVGIYVNDFVTLAQGGPVERRQVRRHFFHVINCVLRPNYGFKYSRQELNFTKKMRCSNSAWKTTKCVLSWLVNTLQHHISLPNSFKKMSSVVCCASLCCWA